MRRRWLALFLLQAFALALTLSGGAFTLESPDISGRLSLKQVYNGLGCHGENISPKLHWRGEPKGTKSFAVTLYDPDAPTKKGWWHWIVFNIPSGVHELLSGAGNPSAHLLPGGAVQSRNDFGTLGYGGACPPAGDRPHRYIVTVYALDVEKLLLGPDTSPARAVSMIESHAIAKASRMAYYGR